jgi:restriction system protein
LVLPTQTLIEVPLLKVVDDNGGELSTAVAIEKVTQFFPEISPEDLASRLKSGANRWKNRVRWAKQNLILQGELDNSVRNIWKITDKGRTRLTRDWPSWRQRKIESLTAQVSENLAQIEPSQLLEAIQHGSKVEMNPEELLEASLSKMTEDLKTEILNTLWNLEPSLFESVTADLLEKMGYGNVQVTGRASDGGIDGHCSLDALGLVKVHYQAKRWKTQVGAKEIRDFIGGLQTKRGERGIFVTTSTFTKEAVETADKAGIIKLVNGEELANLMIKFGLGVNKTNLESAKIDRDYFEGL